MGARRGVFDSTKDVLLKGWMDDSIGLLVGLFSYKGGDPRIQIGPRYFWRKDVDGSLMPSLLKVGRLSPEELSWIASITPDVVRTIAELKDTFLQFGKPDKDFCVVKNAEGEDVIITSLPELLAISRDKPKIHVME